MKNQDSSALFCARFDGPSPAPGEDWFLEGEGTAEIHDGRLALRDQGKGVVLWIRRDFPSDMKLSFDLSFSANRGIAVFFIAARGTRGEDILEDLPPRDGQYKLYTKGRINCYGLSVHRFFLDGRHNEGANIRKNSGFHLVNSAMPDPVTEANRTCRIEIEKSGPRLRMWVDGRLSQDWTDDGAHGAPLEGGKIGFRIRGHETCLMFLDNVVVREIR